MSTSQSDSHLINGTRLQSPEGSFERVFNVKPCARLNSKAEVNIVTQRSNSELLASNSDTAHRDWDGTLDEPVPGRVVHGCL